MLATEVKKRWYKVWSLPSCVSENPTFAGVAFPRRTKTPISEVDGRTEWSVHQGGYVQLSDEEVQSVKDSIKREVQRILDHKSGRGKIFTLGTPNHIPHPTDEPMAFHVRMMAVDGPPEAIQGEGIIELDLPDEAKELLEDPEVRQVIRQNTRRKQSRMRVDDTPIDASQESRQGQTDKSPVS